MRGAPKHYNTRFDVDYCLEHYPAETKAFLAKKLTEVKQWQVTGKLTEGDAGITDETHKVVEVQDTMLTSLASIPAGAGVIPSANLPSQASTIIGTIYPIGSIYISTLSTNPATLLGLGTWEAFGEGRVLVGKASSGTFVTPGATGGEETHILTTDEMPAHTHVVANVNGNNTVNGSGSAGTAGGYASNKTSNSAGGGGAHNNLQPYIVVYMWKRIS